MLPATISNAADSYLDTHWSNKCIYPWDTVHETEPSGNEARKRVPAGTSASVHAIPALEGREGTNCTRTRVPLPRATVCVKTKMGKKTEEGDQLQNSFLSLLHDLSLYSMRTAL